MSLDIELIQDDSTVFEYNITHNLSVMAQKCGLYVPLWRPDSAQWSRAKDILMPMIQGLAKLQDNPEFYKTFEPSNKWGRYEDLEKCAIEYIAACQRYPNAVIRAY